MFLLVALAVSVPLASARDLLKTKTDGDTCPMNCYDKEKYDCTLKPVEKCDYELCGTGKQCCDPDHCEDYYNTITKKQDSRCKYDDDKKDDDKKDDDKKDDDKKDDDKKDDDKDDDKEVSDTAVCTAFVNQQVNLQGATIIGDVTVIQTNNGSPTCVASVNGKKKEYKVPVAEKIKIKAQLQAKKAMNKANKKG